MIIIDAIINFWRYIRNNFRKYPRINGGKNEIKNFEITHYLKERSKLSVEEKKVASAELAKSTESSPKGKGSIIANQTTQIENEILQKHICESDNSILPNGPIKYTDRQLLHEKILAQSAREEISYSEALNKLLIS